MYLDRLERFSEAPICSAKNPTYMEPKTASQPRRVAIVHPGDGSWGSDRVLEQTVPVLHRVLNADAATTELWLSDSGEVGAEFLARIGAQPVRRHGLVLRRRDLGTWRVLKLPLAPLFVLADAVRLRTVDRVFVNTCIEASALLAARVSKTPGFVHVHEIPTTLNERRLFAALVLLSGLTPIYISEACRNSLLEVTPLRFRSVRMRGHLVHNGTAPPGAPSELGTQEPLRVLCVGRFTGWKGQLRLLQALRVLDDQGVSYEARLVGLRNDVAPGFLAELNEERRGLVGTVEFVEYEKDVTAHYQWCDIVVVPSLQPEPFGLVAIEAGLMNRAVLGVRSGGLAEVVIDGETGTLVTDPSPEAFAAALSRYAKDHDLLSAHSANAQRIYTDSFSFDAFVERMTSAIGQPL